MFLGNVLKGYSDEGYFLNGGPISVIHFLNPYESCSHTFFSVKLGFFFTFLMKRKSNKARLTILTSSAGWNCSLSMKRTAVACYLMLTDLTVSYCLSYLYLSNRHQAKLFFFPI